MTRDALLTPLIVFCMHCLIKKTYGNSSLSVKIVVLTIDKTSELLFLANILLSFCLLNQI